MMIYKYILQSMISSNNCVYSTIMINLLQTPPNMSSIGAVCDRLGKTFLTLLVANLGTTGGLRVNSSPVKVNLIIFPLFLPEGKPILPIPPNSLCVSVSKTKRPDFLESGNKTARAVKLGTVRDLVASVSGRKGFMRKVHMRPWCQD